MAHRSRKEHLSLARNWALARIWGLQQSLANTHASHSAAPNTPFRTTTSSATTKTKRPPKPLSRRFECLLPLLVSLAVTALLGVILHNMFWSTPQKVIISDAITTDTVWDAKHIYQLSAPITVNNGARLTIEAGTHIIGEAGASLIIAPSSQLIARGKKSKPIVFTSAQPIGKKQSGDWGGLVLTGHAVTNHASLTQIKTQTQRQPQLPALHKGGQRLRYGGDNPAHNCGELAFVRVEYAGNAGALTLAGCGADTHISHVQIHRAHRDGLHILGGSTNLKHLVISQSRHDGLHWNAGWTGKGQFIFIQKTHNTGNSAIKASNHSQHYNADPRSEPMLANITLLGSGKADTEQQGLWLHQGSIIHLRNSIIEGFAAGAFAIQDAETARAFEAHATLQGTVIASKSGLPLFTDHGLTTQIQAQSILQHSAHALQLLQRSAFNAAAYEYTMPLPIIRDASIASPTFEHDKDTFFTTDADYVGAFDPSASKTWMNSWTHFR